MKDKIDNFFQKIARNSDKKKHYRNVKYWKIRGLQILWDDG